MTLLPRSTITIACLVLAFALAVGLVWPKYKDLRDLRQKIKAKTQELEYQEKYLSELKGARAQLVKYSQTLKKIDSALPSFPDLPALFNYFQKVSSQNGLVLQSIGSPSAIGSGLISAKEIQFVLTLSGSYSSFKNFLSTLQKSSRLISIDSIAFSSVQQHEVFTFNITVKMHSY